MDITGDEGTFPPGDIISERWAELSRNGERLHQRLAAGELTPSEAASVADLIRSCAAPIVQTEQARIVLEQKKLGQH